MRRLPRVQTMQSSKHVFHSWFKQEFIQDKIKIQWLHGYGLINKLAAYRRWAHLLDIVDKKQNKYMADKQFHQANNKWDITKDKMKERKKETKRNEKYTVTRKQLKQIVVKKKKKKKKKKKIKTIVL